MEVWQKCVAFVDAGTCWGYNETWFVQIPRVAERFTYKTLGNTKQLHSQSIWHAVVSTSTKEYVGTELKGENRK